MTDQYLTPIPFLYQGDKLVRVVIGPDLDPWFAGVDVCRVLGISKHHQALNRLKSDERGTCSVGTPGGEQQLIIVSEPGLYRLIFSSNKPDAERIQDWIYHEVLPSIRRTGGYRIKDGEGSKAWSEKIREVRLSAAELRRAYGPHKAARLAVDLWAKVGIFVEDPCPPQRELDLEDDDDIVVPLRPAGDKE